jgi:hypothetical protein
LKRQNLLFILFAMLTATASGDGFNTIAKTNSLLKKAEKAMKEKSFRIASKTYEEALKENPDLPAQTRLNLAHAYFESGQNRLAQKNYLSSLNGLSSVAQKSNACLQLGNLSIKEKDYKSALNWYQKSLLHQPDNTTARRNFEMAWKLNKQKEEENEKEKKNPNPERNSGNENQQNQQQKDQNQGKSEPEQNKSNQNQNGKGRDSNQQQNQKSEGKERTKDKEESKKPETGKRGEEKQEEGKEEEKDEEGKESRKKTNESREEDPDSYRMDKKKLKESGLNEEQAKNMLKAMRQSEVKYLQQRQFKGKTNTKSGSGPRW